MRSLLSLVLVTCACASTGVTDVGDGAAPDVVAADASASDAATTDDAGTSRPDAGFDCESPSSTGPTEVRTRRATVAGVERGETHAWLGVRYAEPPVGVLRLAAPTPPRCEPQLQVASDFGAICPQLDRQGAFVGEEDCLFLNVWAPKNRVARGSPVMFFIHGGGNNQGSSSVMAGTRLVYDGEALARRGNVVVTVNYRLGALGFAAHSALDAEASSGNYAIRDLVRALEWVRDDIEGFGGDPDRVMIFGESAGGVNVCALYTSPLAKGLFSRALMQSGGCTATSKASGVAATERLLAAMSCGAMSPLECLRAKTPDQILAALPPEVSGLSASDFGTIVDGAVLPRAPMEALASGDHADVPLILGSNADETYQFLPPPAQIATEAAFAAAARQFLLGAGIPMGLVASWIALYPMADYGGDPHAALVALTTDLRWSCSGRRILRTLATSATAPLYRYYFTHRLDAMRAPMASRAVAYHGLELFYVFGSVDGAGGYRPTAEDLALSERMQRYWSRFAETGTPSGGADPPWVRYDATDPFLRLTEPESAGAGVRTAQCDAIEALF